MLNYIWASMMIIGILFGSINGNMKEVTEAAINSAGEAVSLCISMAGIMSFWVGLMEIAEKTGLIEAFTKKIDPFIRFLFPNLPENHKAKDYISLNFIANFCGLGWAATPAGLRAMEELSKLEEERGTPKTGDKSFIASNEMCTFLILNISSLQLIPVNIIAFRNQYGSINPTAIIGPGILASACSTFVAILFCKMVCRERKKKICIQQMTIGMKPCSTIGVEKAD